VNIDVHCHLIPDDCLDMHATLPDGREFGVRCEREASDNDILITDGRRNRFADYDQLWDVERRLRDMGTAGVDVQAISVPPFMYFYAIAATTAAGFARRLNDGLTAVARKHPDRFVTLATVPLQDTDLAVAELNRAVGELGMRGVEINSNVAGENLDTPRLLPFFERVEQLDIPIFIHPHYVAAQERLRDYYLINLIGNPLDTTIAAASLIFGGVMAKLPRLTVYLAHGGGNTPYICGRWQHGWEVRPEPKQLLDRAPMEYVRRLYFDTITHSREALDYLVRTFGSDKVMLGTDYPFDMGDERPLETIEALGLSEQQQQQIRGGNAARLFKLTQPIRS
jgi:aminocarboxymuconate-semialdehyde decarboxylase